ncbi:MAG: YihY/virulence factor BrkB family protein [Candidatus Eremiobacteraeota bacterium]|nr:YihY/virulence factor BrkB family protein [Candidatus Eremiobacteraeota bacterium]
MASGAGRQPGAIGFLRELYATWQKDNVQNDAAALAFYSASSIAPLLIISLMIVGFVLGSSQEAQVRSYAMETLAGGVGRSGAQVVDQLVTAANHPQNGKIATALSLVMLVLGGGGVFSNIQATLNRIWQCQPANQPIWERIRQQALALSLVVATGLLLLLSFLMSAALQFLEAYFANRLPALHVLWHVADLGVSFVVAAVMFAAIFKVLPDTPIAWRDVALGAALTALLFVLGQFAISLYVARSGGAAAYGVGGAIVVVLIWVYYSAQILFLGAEFTKVWSERRV